MSSRPTRYPNLTKLTDLLVADERAFPQPTQRAPMHVAGRLAHAGVLVASALTDDQARAIVEAGPTRVIETLERIARGA